VFTSIVYVTIHHKSVVIAYKHGFANRLAAIRWGKRRADDFGIPRDVGSIATEHSAGFFERTGYEVLLGAEDTAPIFCTEAA
jgi:hypothetical protein